MRSNLTSLNQDRNMLNQRDNFGNTKFLASNQTALRLRHLTQIIGYNLTSYAEAKTLHSNPLPSSAPRSVIKNGYYFTLESLVSSDPEYTSELHPSTSPAWKSFDPGELFPINLQSRKGIVIRAWLRKENEVIPVTSWGVNFSGLVPVSLKEDFAANTLVFKLRGRCYTSHDNLLKRGNVDLHLALSLALSETKPSYSVSSLCRMHSNKRAQRKQERKRENLRETLEAKGVRSDSKRMTLQKEIENAKLRISLLVEEYEVEMNKLRSLKLAADNLDYGNQDKGIELLERYQSLNRNLSSLRLQGAKLSADTEVRDVVAKVRERRCQLLAQLPLVFPVQKNLEESVKFTICGVRLPNAESYTGFPEQSLSVALGFVAQLLVKMAFLVSIPLKYPITLRGSTSSIADLTSTQLLNAETQFPLYTRGKEREKLHFNYGVFLLNKNIAQLRWSCGLPTSDLRLTLQNVWNFLCSLHDESVSTTRAFMPDTVVSPIVLPASLRRIVQPHPSLHDPTPRLPLNSLNSYSKSLKSLPHIPPTKNKICIKNSKEEDYLRGSASEVDSRMEKLESDGAQSDIDATSYNLKLANKKQIHLRKLELKQFSLKPTSFSLDQGLNFIQGEGIEVHSLHEDSSNSSQFTTIPTTSSGSFPNLASLKTGTDDVAVPTTTTTTSAEDVPFDDETTELLKSWHENDPSPYNSIAIGSTGSEKLEPAVPKDDASNHISLKAPSPPGLNDSNTSSRTEPENSSKKEENRPVLEEETPVSENVVNGLNDDKLVGSFDSTPTGDKESTEKRERESEGRRKKEEEGQNEREIEGRRKKEEEEKIKMSLSDFGMDDDPFLDDVASRTSILASQNCSFKFFSRQSTQE